ncbi:MAG: hypothetical protein ABL888_20995 [Pirellulaceae bacterium]
MKLPLIFKAKNIPKLPVIWSIFGYVSVLISTNSFGDEAQLRRFNEQAPKIWRQQSNKYDSTGCEVTKVNTLSKVSASVSQSGEFASFSGTAKDIVGNFVVVANEKYIATIQSTAMAGGPYHIMILEQHSNLSRGDEKQKLLQVTMPSLCFFRWHLPDSLDDLDGIGVKGPLGFRVVDATTSTNSDGNELVSLKLISVIRDASGQYVKHVSNAPGAFSVEECTLKLLPQNEWSIESVEITGVAALPSGTQSLTMKSVFFYQGNSHHPSSKHEVIELNGSVKTDEKYIFSDLRRISFDPESCYLKYYGLPEPSFSEKRSSFFSYFWKFGIVFALVVFFAIRFLRR